MENIMRNLIQSCLKYLTQNIGNNTRGKIQSLNSQSVQTSNFKILVELASGEKKTSKRAVKYFQISLNDPKEKFPLLYKLQEIGLKMITS